MHAEESKHIFLHLLNISVSHADEATIILPHLISFNFVWDTFKQFIAITLEEGEQIFGFECAYEESKLCISLKRNMYPPFEDNPDEVYPLNFEVTAFYVTPKPSFYEYIFFTEEVQTSLDKAVSDYIQRVEAHRALWDFVSVNTPSQIHLFQ